jgi:hypothetical protein
MQSWARAPDENNEISNAATNRMAKASQIPRAPQERR